MRFDTVEEYKKEIIRVDEAMRKTKSFTLHRDYEKYKKRLQREMRMVKNE